MTPVRLVCFDWGGVILRICRSWKEGCERAGVPVYPQLSEPVARAQRMALANEYQCGRLSCDAFFDALAQSTNGLHNPDEVRQVHDAWLIEEYPGVGSLIDRLKATPGVRTGMLSNTNAAHWSRQHDGPNGFPAAARLEVRLASHELGMAKPDPDIYRVATGHFGVAPEEILFFDDLPENVEAARAAGWKTRHIDHLGDPCAQMQAHLKQLGVLED